MDLFTWNSQFELGIAEVDAQHKTLIELTNRFGLKVSQQQIDKDDLDQVISELVAYAQYHFREEQNLMLNAELDNSYTSVHLGEHRSFTEEIETRRKTKGFTVETGKTLFTFLVNWLVYHILETDTCMVKQMKLIDDGVSPAEAFLFSKNEPSNVKEFLINALLNLFDQVSKRNMELQELNLELEQRVEERTRELAAANEQLGELAMTDTLTGLPNRRKALQSLKKLWEKEKQSLSCIMIDADRFKQINDRFGHDAGDLVLNRLATELAHVVRTDDMVCRLGGDEFLILCPNADLKGALLLAKQLHQSVSQMKVVIPGGAWHGSISVGVAARNEQTTSPEELIKHADNGVLLAKEQGKNCIRVGS